MWKRMWQGAGWVCGAAAIAACASTGTVASNGTEAEVLIPVADTSVFAPLTLGPAPSAIRTANGAPGSKYWQNRADYDLAARLDTVTGVLHGTMRLRYTNNSPDVLPIIWFQTEQNNARSVPATASDSAKNADFGYVYDSFTQTVGGKESPVTLEDHGTVSKATLPAALRPGETATIQIAWHFRVPPVRGRMGREGSLFEIAQWYPRVNVYDDVKGWNLEPYAGQGEFYLEYGDYTLSVTVPSNFIVAATGVLANPEEVLTPTQRTRLAAALRGDSVVRIVTAEELNNGSGHLKSDGMVTWKFTAKNVRDAVWCASPQYQWDATAWNGIQANAYYRPPAAATWREAADMARMSILEYSGRWYQYPYPQVTVAEGPVGGMEYPMLSMNAPYTNIEQLYDVITHEVGHNWYPMVVGSNERVHTWMDEGFNQFVNSFSTARRYPNSGDQTRRADQYRGVIETFIMRGNDFKTDTPADSVPGQVYGYVGYFKPAGVLQMLRRDVLGPELFDQAFRTYTERWAYKHPTPQDFFRTMNSVTKRDLSWFWREWFYETPKFDQSVDSVQQSTADGKTTVRIVYGNKARGVMPILARITFSDGTTANERYRAEVWRKNSTQYPVTYTYTGKTVTHVEIDPDRHLVDVDRANNTWTAPSVAPAP